MTSRRQLGQSCRETLLLEVPGIGERRKALLKAFGSIKALREATVEELAAVEGMNQAAAASLYAYLQEYGAQE